MSVKSCFFIGHREAPDEVYPALRAAVEKHVTEYGVREFIVGHYGYFDRMAARAVIDAKKSHSEVSLLLLLPYHPAERPIKTPEGFDNSYYPEGMETVPRRFAIVRANRCMIAQADYLIAYARYAASSARDLLEYAQRREQRGLISVMNLADQE